jgi:hypothetical protein
MIGDKIMTTRALNMMIVFVYAISLRGQSRPNFSGEWREQTDSKTQHSLEVEQKGQKLRVNTVVTNSDGTRNLDVKYAIGGSETAYKGLDGDKFLTSVQWVAGTLVFDTIEQENSSQIPQKAIWTLSEDGNTLQVDRQITKLGRTTHSSTTYIRQH